MLLDIPASHVVWEDRFPRLMSEILHYDPDILCLQEVQHDHFESFFNESLKKEGYDGIYKKRTGDKKDGCAIFFKTLKVILAYLC